MGQVLVTSDIYPPYSCCRLKASHFYLVTRGKTYTTRVNQDKFAISANWLANALVFLLLGNYLKTSSFLV